MTIVNLQPAMQELAKRLRGQIGQPFLIIIEREEPLIRYAIAPPGGFLPHRHPFDATHTVREFAFGVLKSDILVEDKNHLSQLGLSTERHSTKREMYDGIEVVEGPVWLSALDNQLITFFGTRASVLIGATEIASWTNNVENSLWTSDTRLFTVSALAIALEVNIQQWDELRTQVLSITNVLRDEAEEKFEDYQQEAARLLMEASTRGPLRTLAEDYAHIANQLRLLTGETPKEPVVFPPFEEHQAK